MNEQLFDELMRLLDQAWQLDDLQASLRSKVAVIEVEMLRASGD